MNAILDHATRGTGSSCVCVLAEGGRSAACARDGGRVVHQPGLAPGSRWYVGIEDKITLARLGVALKRDAEGVATVEFTPSCETRGAGGISQGAGSEDFPRRLSAAGFASGPAGAPEQKEFC